MVNYWTEPCVCETCVFVCVSVSTLFPSIHVSRPSVPASSLRSTLPPSDGRAPCPQRLTVFESCRDIKRGRAPAQGHANSRPAASPEVGGNATSSASLIGPPLIRNGMDTSILFQRETCSWSHFHVTYVEQ